MENTRAIDRYLQAILILSRKYFCVRSVDVAHYLGCSKAAVSVALKQLGAEKLVNTAPDGALSLTAIGEDRAWQLHRRCLYFRALLRQAGVDDAVARQEAGAIERALSNASFDALQAYLAQHSITVSTNMDE
ncbi:MAG: metal-dependent transcriptional regulator [Clostridia bacterium]|nr:metal-dependent transcriptional regulator [Clostridia bacterium]